MSNNQVLLETFYAAFKKRDHKAMAECYHPRVIFNDAVFRNLEGWRASAMWRMLCERGKDLQVTYSDISATSQNGRALWEAQYTFSQTGNKVHNRVKARFEFLDGKISSHTDDFSLQTWLGMAMGAKGKLLGYLPPFRKLFRMKAKAALEAYIAKNDLGPADFPNGA